MAIVVGHITNYLAEFNTNVTQNDRVYISGDYFRAIGLFCWRVSLLNDNHLLRFPSCFSKVLLGPPYSIFLVLFHCNIVKVRISMTKIRFHTGNSRRIFNAESDAAILFILRLPIVTCRINKIKNISTNIQILI